MTAASLELDAAQAAYDALGGRFGGLQMAHETDFNDQTDAISRAEIVAVREAAAARLDAARLRLLLAGARARHAARKGARGGEGGGAGCRPGLT